MKNFITIFSIFALSLSLNAASVQDILAYSNSGDSSAWYHELSRDAFDVSKREAVEKTLLEAMQNPEISDDAFRLCAKVMKFAATEKSLPELVKLAGNPARTAEISDILKSAEYASARNSSSDLGRKIRFEDFFEYALLATPPLNDQARMNFLDNCFVDSNRPGRNAARVANSGRTFENSDVLVKAYPKLEEGAKVAAIRSFALSGDKRFYDVFKNEVRDSDSAVNVEAVFACAYIAPDSAVPSLEALLDAKNNRIAFAANYALTRMPSEGVDKALKSSYAKNKNTALLNILLDRGNTDMRAELFKRMFDGKDTARRDIVRIFENQVGYGGLKETFERMQKADAAVRKDALGALIKFVSKDKDGKFRMRIYKDYFENSGLSENELQVVKSRLADSKKKKK